LYASSDGDPSFRVLVGHVAEGALGDLGQLEGDAVDLEGVALLAVPVPRWSWVTSPSSAACFTRSFGSRSAGSLADISVCWARIGL